VNRYARGTEEISRKPLGGDAQGDGLVKREMSYTGTPDWEHAVLINKGVAESEITKIGARDERIILLRISITASSAISCVIGTTGTPRETSEMNVLYQYDPRVIQTPTGRFDPGSMFNSVIKQAMLDAILTYSSFKSPYVRTRDAREPTASLLASALGSFVTQKSIIVSNDPIKESPLA
jgi:hypothetical protein